ncbi:hypothetical protein [Kibdelosporangium aridum]|uniref:Uncharacterized protein n=1 Tax=Kibdelosporangium aridum TaxID=2030 RepID=A0A1W2FZ72_KIBAR|nr:hypothetical protein [Kibdelosporangium aridum]SMD27163.1 hypothetical protein SAMN05661093_10760 [Kibdelosporangium aridum]
MVIDETASTSAVPPCWAGEILTGLDDYLAFLATGSRVAVPRVQTLRAAIDWSFGLCSHDEQQLWPRCSPAGST